MGEEHTDAGVTLLGKVRHIGPDAWFHILFPPLESSEINLLERKLEDLSLIVFVSFSSCRTG